jgi:hypothetical protein
VKHGRDLLDGHAGALFGEALAGLGAQAECGHADQGEHANAVAQSRCGEAGDVAPEGETRQPQITRAWQQLIEPRNDDLGARCGNERLGWHRRLAKPGKIRNPELIVPRKLGNIA